MPTRRAGPLLIMMLVAAGALSPAAATAQRAGVVDLYPVLEVSLGSEVGQLRAAPVRLGADAPRAFVLAYAEDFDVDPYHEMFFYPRGTLKLAVFDERGEILWRKDLGRGVVPGMWFTPVFPFDLDGDGVDEIWFVNNPDEDHPLALSKYRLERLDARTGETLGSIRWPAVPGQPISHSYRNFIFGGHVKGEPVLVTAQGTYGPMALQGWNPDLSPRWERKIRGDDPGARGSHMSPIADLDDDGVEEVLWGERRIELDRGAELFCAACDSWNNHSDVIQPFRDPRTSRWFVYTTREKDVAVAPRIAVYDDAGEPVWGDLERGHVDMGWVARSGTDELTAMGIRIDGKALGPEGRTHSGVEEFVYDALTGRRKTLPFSVYRTLPVDVNGDGVHELVYGVPGGDGRVIDWKGRLLGEVGGTVAMASRLLDLPGEQLLVHYPDGTVRIWADRNARDSAEALERYADPIYLANQRLTAQGANRVNLGGL